MADLTKLANLLDNALTGHKAVPRLTLTHADLTLDQAYEIQDLGVEKRLERGEKVIGYKVGLTSRAKMEQMGLRTPIYGVLTDKMRVKHEEEVSTSHWVHAKIEPEIAFHIAKDLKGVVTEKDVIDACDGAAPALEILDSRYEGFKYFSLPDVVADNSSSAAFVVGPKWIPLKGLDLSNLKMEILIDGQPVAEARSSEVLGNPIKAIVELCHILSSRDLYLKKGSVVMSGAATQAFELKKGRRFSTRVETLGEVHVNVKNQDEATAGGVGAAGTGGCPFGYGKGGASGGGQPRVYGESDLNYNAYLKIPELLSSQVLQSNPPHHDELLFIIIHQAYELWFKLILHELENVIHFMKKAEPLQAHHFMKRVVKVMGLLVQQIHLLETMTPADFLKFRGRLMPASGFQSCQFREIEFIAGMKEASYLDFFQNDPPVKKKLEKRFNEPDLFSAYLDMLVTLKVAAKKDLETPEGQTKAIVPIYQNAEDHLPLYLLTESLVEFDENLALWREHHVRVVERIIGAKTGTGGSSGVEYLRTTTSKKCFPVLWNVRNFLA